MLPPCFVRTAVRYECTVAFAAVSNDNAPDVALAAPGSRLGLSREGIVDAARALLDREGLDAFSMRRLAGELGVGTMTVYGYFAGKDQLLDAVVDSGASRIASARARGSWKTRLRRLMLDLRQSLIDHPGIVELRLKRPLVSPGALELTEAGLRILLDAGFSKRDASRAYRMLFVYTFGFSAFGPGRGAERERAETLDALRALPADRYPTIADCVDEASAAMADQTLFETGLNWMLEGLEASLEHPS